MYNEKTAVARFRSFGTFALLPLLVFTTVVLVPFVVGVFMTFTDWTGASSAFEWQGIANYASALTDPLFWSAMGVTLKYVFFSVVLTNVLAFVLALLVTSGMKGQNFFRTGFFTPNLIGGIILGFIWQFMFTRVFVHVGEALGWEIFSTSWLGDPHRAFWALVIVGVWQNAGYMMLIYIAGLAGISESLTEAANLDGANYFQQLWKIKLPLMIPAFTISLFLTLQRSFLVYDTNLSLTRGGPYRSTELVAMHVYNEAFLYQNFGSGQAKAIILFAIVAAIVLIQVSVMKKVEVES